MGWIASRGQDFRRYGITGEHGALAENGPEYDNFLICILDRNLLRVNFNRCMLVDEFLK